MCQVGARADDYEMECREVALDSNKREDFELHNISWLDVEVTSANPGKRIEGAQVYVVPAAKREAEESDWIDTDGGTYSDVVRQGEYLVGARAEGYEAESKEVSVDDEEVAVELELKRLDTKA